MSTSGSRISIGNRTMVVRLLLVAIVAAITIGALSIYTANQTSAGVGLKVTVNSVGNTDDGDCTGVPNEGSGDCTLREAINVVNEGKADEINFHKTVFSKASPGVIQIDLGDDLTVGAFANCLPPIERDVIIDSSNTGVILDGDANDDLTLIADCSSGNRRGVIQVDASHNGFDFALIGGKNFIIREFTGETDGIKLDGCFDTCVAADYYSFGDVTITGYIFDDGDAGEDDVYHSQDGIDIDDTWNVFNVNIDNVDIIADDDGVEVSVNDARGTVADKKMSDNIVNVTNSRIIGDDDNSGSGDGVEISFNCSDAAGCSVNGKLTANVSDNDSITSLGEDAVDVEFAGPADGTLGGAEMNVWVNNNRKLHGGDHAVDVDIDSDGGGVNSGSADIDVQVNNNGLTDAAEENAVEIAINVCCPGSQSTSSVQVNDNDDIIGDEAAVEVFVDLGCGDGNDSTVNVDRNGSLEGQKSDGVEVDVDVGEIATGCPGDLESDGNTSLITVNDNDRIDGGDDQGVDIDVDVGSDDGAGDDNTNTVEVNGNGRIDGEDEGVEIDADAGSQSGADADENTILVTVANNDNLTGNDDEGVQVTADTGVETGPNDGPGMGTPAGNGTDGDENSTTVNIRDNGNIEGGDDDGIDIDVQAGGGNVSSRDNSNEVNITGNGEIIGRESSIGDGIDVDFEVCCDPGNTNTLLIADNGDIIGRNDDGIDIDLCCSINTVSILNNQAIRGNGGDGIDYNVDNISDGNDDYGEGCPQDCGVWSSINILTISGNNIFNSQEDGIDIFGGQFQNPPVAGRDDLPEGKSVIQNNQIHHNRDNGIQINNSSGLNVQYNDIFENGDDPGRDRGIEIVCDEATGQYSADVNELIACNQNRISQNNIWDNVGMGIELVGDTDADGDGDRDIGCVFFATLMSPNDCLPLPKITTQLNDKLVGTACSLCLVEVFWVDDDPADQLPLAVRQHGEARTFFDDKTVAVSAIASTEGDWSVNVPCGLGDGSFTATATDKLKNTSEFAANFVTLGTPACATPTPPPTDTPEPAPAADTPGPTEPAATATPVPAPAKVCGDVNGDGAVNSIDASLIFQLGTGLITSLENESSADVNNDGAINSVDGALILQVGAGFIDASALTCP